MEENGVDFGDGGRRSLGAGRERRWESIPRFGSPDSMALTRARSSSFMLNSKGTCFDALGS